MNSQNHTYQSGIKIILFDFIFLGIQLALALLIFFSFTFQNIFFQLATFFFGLSMLVSFILSIKLCAIYDKHLEETIISEPEIYEQIFNFLLPFKKQTLIKLRVFRFAFYGRLIIGRNKKLLENPRIKKIVNSKKFPSKTNMLDKILSFIFILSLVFFLIFSSAYVLNK